MLECREHHTRNVAANGYTVNLYLDFFITIGYIQNMTPQDMQEWRARMGWTQEQAANWLGVERGTVNRYENGKRSIPQMAENLCGALIAIRYGGGSLQACRALEAEK